MRRPLLTTVTALCFLTASAVGWTQTVQRTGATNFALGVVERLGRVTEPLGGNEFFDYVALEIRAATHEFEREVLVLRATPRDPAAAGTGARS